MVRDYRHNQNQMNISIKKKIKKIIFDIGYNKVCNMKNINEIKAGRNSKIYKVDLNKKSIILKFYLGKGTQRIRRERQFYKYLNKINNKNTIKPISFNLKNNFAVYPYLEGKKIKKISTAHILKACNFIKKINNRGPSKLFIAVDGIKNRKDHLKLVEKKINLMKLIKKNSLIKKDCFLFLKYKIIPKYNDIKKNLIKSNILKSSKFKLLRDQMIISPSDFGFHNIIESNKKLFFLDFEYAGLDDPVKLICDFYCQPDQSISILQKKLFIEKFLSRNEFSKDIKFLVKKFLPVHQLKWCCIILNEFKKKEYIDYKNSVNNDILQSQLIKAKNYFRINLEAR